MRLTVVLALGFIGIFGYAQDTCSAEDGPVDCAACRKGADVNNLAGIPRVTFGFQPVSDNLGDYAIFVCPEERDEACEMAKFGDAQSSLLNAGTSTDSLWAYVQSLALYVIFALVVGIFAPILALIFCMCRCRYCCCCCEHGTCGKDIPTYRDHGKWCGFRELQKPASVVDDGTPLYHYPAWSRWTVRVLLLANFLAVVGFAAIGHFLGNVGLTDGAKAIARSPTSLASLVQGMETPLGNFLINTASDTLAPFFLDTNRTIYNYTDLSVVHDMSVCIVYEIENSLPDPDALLDEILKARTPIVRARNVSLDTKSDVSSLNDTVNEIPGTLLPLELLLNQTRDGRDQLQTDLAEVDGVLTEMNTTVQDFQNPSDGLPVLQQGLTGYQNGPSDTDINVVSANLTSVGGGDLNGNSAEADREGTVDRALTLKREFEDMPDLGNVADTLEAHNARVHALRNGDLIDRAIASLQSTNATINSFPTADEIRQAIADAEALANRTNLDSLELRFTELNDTVQSIPSTQPIRDEINKLDGVKAILDCMRGLVAEIRGLNESFIRLPDAIADIDNILADANATYYDAKQQADEAARQMDDMQASIDENLNMTQLEQYLDDTRELKQTMDNALNFSSLLDQLDSFEAQRASLDLSSLVDQIVALNDTLFDDGVLADQATIDDMRQLQSSRTNVTDALATAIDATVDFNNTQRCADTGQADYGTPCSTDGDCAATCEYGIPVCVDETTGAYIDDTYCDADSAPCPSGRKCSLDYVSVVAAATALDGYASSTKPDVSTLQASTSQLDSDMDAMQSSSESQQSQLVEVNSTLADMSLESTQQDLDKVKADASPENLPLEDMRRNIDNSLEQIASALDTIDSLTGPDGIIASLNSSLASVEDYKEQAANLRESSGRAKEWLTQKLGKDLDIVSRPNLEKAWEETGLDQVALEIARMLDNTVDHLNYVIEPMMDTEIGFNATESANDYGLGPLRVLSHPEYMAHGPFYFFVSLANSVEQAGTQVEVMDPDDEESDVELHTVQFDGDGNEYPDGKICVTQQCIDATIDLYTAEPLTENDETSFTGVPLSLQMVLSIPYVIPVLIALFAVVPALGFCGKRWHRYFTCCSSCMMCTVLPFILIFAGLFFPFIVVVHDTCRGATNVGYNYIAGSDIDLCEENLGGTVDAEGRCIMSFSGANATLRLAETYQGLFGGCTDEIQNEVFPETYNSLKIYVEQQSDDFQDGTMQDMLDSFNAQFQLRRLSRGLVDNTTRIATEFIGDLGDAWGCDKLHPAIFDLKEALCCETLTAIYWINSSWYMIAFCFLLCGYPGAVLGYKRLNNELWGDYYDDMTNPELHMARRKRQQQEQVLAGGGGGGGGGGGAANSRAVGPAPSPHGPKSAADVESAMTADFQVQSPIAPRAGQVEMMAYHQQPPPPATAYRGPGARPYHPGHYRAAAPPHIAGGGGYPQQPGAYPRRGGGR